MRQIRRIERKVIRKEGEIESIMVDRNEITNKVSELKMHQTLQRDTNRDKIEMLTFRIE